MMIYMQIKIIVNNINQYSKTLATDPDLLTADFCLLQGSEVESIFLNIYSSFVFF